MSEQYVLEIAVNMANGWLSFNYTEKFLQGTYDYRKNAMLQWIIVYTICQMLISQILEFIFPYNHFLTIIPHFILFITLQFIFFEKNRSKQIFIIMSFIAGWEILRFTVSPLAHAIFNIWSPFWEYLVNQSIIISIAPIETTMNVMMLINKMAVFIVIGICRAIQIGILFLYLRIISEKFTHSDYEWNFHDSLFLIFPCITVLCIDFTIRLTAFSANNSAIFLIYERTPETLLMLPVVSILLLGIVISSVILFQNLVLHKNEEQKRLLLENRVIDIHREIEELQDIYSDIRGLRHDLRDHIASLTAYVRKISNGENEEAENYLRNMTDTVNRLDFTDKTGNPITDIIIHQTRQRAKKKGINFDSNFCLPKNCKIDIYDISIILNNALQNALEACAIIEDEKKIQIRSFTKGNLFFIEVENNFVGNLNWNKKVDIPHTTKEEKQLHGMGLSNIQRCARKYRGDIDICISEGQDQKQFILTVMLYEKSDD